MDIKQKIKEKQQEYRRWRLQPFTYEFTEEKVHRCVNCDHEYTGNFCPYCSQKYNVGRMTWHSIWQEFLNVWGMGGRSLLYSLWQLLWRPGYFISDYINGRRQVSFPPVKMLFLIAIFVWLMKYYLLPEEIDKDIFEPDEYGLLQPLIDFLEWMRDHRDWGTLVLAVSLIFPTWAIFREAPRNTHVSIPQCFFIQILMCTQTLLFKTIEGVCPQFNLVTALWVVTAYKQLFSYGWWGTIWRTASVYLCTLFLAMGLSSVFNLTMGLIFDSEIEVVMNIGMLILCLIVLYTVFFFSFFFNRQVWKHHSWWGTFWRLTVTLLLPFIILFTVLIFWEDEEEDEIQHLQQEQTSPPSTSYHTEEGTYTFSQTI